MTTSATNELGKHPSKKVITELLGNQQRKEQACSGLMEHISKLWGDKRPLKEAIGLSESTKAMKNFFHQEDRRKLGSLISTIIATFLREGFRWNMTQDKSNEEIGGFKISHSWQHVNHETQTQIVKNDITPPQKIREKELHFRMQDEECLNFSKQTCVEHHVYFRV